ncbi:MAG: DNA primase [Parcubacteria group bacterium Greene0416_79]|nr:MAG: DNA primase [Parcubacteria group bacterium Greene0416_79]
MSSPVEQIKERLNIADVVGNYVKLERAGASLKAKCPFHNERTPSFFVSPARGSFYCFGCGKGGDLFTFVQEFEGLDFVGALRVLAERAGVTLTRIDPKERSLYARLYLCLEKAARFFEAELAKSGEARSYLSSRGVLPETMREWRLGFAPAAWRTLFEHLSREGFTPEEMEKVGMVRNAPPKEGERAASAERHYDWFRGRVIFPILDSAGRIIAFSGRILPTLDDGKTGKYINSPETPLFNKSETLYGFNRAKNAIRQKDATILVEGQMDLLMAHQAGYAHAVAVSGTALTERHLARLKRLSENLLIAFDADPAGAKASERAIRLALLSGFTVRVIALLGGKDPAELIFSDLPAWERGAREAKHVIDFLLQGILSSSASGREVARAVEEKLLPFVSLLPSRVEQSHFIRAIADATGLRADALYDSLKRVPRGRADGAPALPPVSRDEPAEGDALLRRAFSLLLFLESRKELAPAASSFRSRLARLFQDAKFKEQYDAFVSRRDALLYEAEFFLGAGGSGVVSEKTRVEIEEELLNRLEEATLSSALEETLRALGMAERANRSAVPALLLECKRLGERLAQIKAVRFNG